MSKKRTVSRYVLATAFTGLMGAAIGNAYKKIGTTPEPITEETLKKGIISASLLAGMVWAITVL